MPLKTLTLRPGIFRENTRYSAEGGWYECDKVRFRSGQPEKIGGWQQEINDQFLGVCRALWPWDIYLGMGTNLKYYVYYGAFYDITPVRVTSAVAAITTYDGFSYAAVSDAGTGVGTFATGELTVGSYVTFTAPGTLGSINFATSGVNGTAEYRLISNVTLITCTTSGTTLTVASVDSPGIIVSGAAIDINGVTYTITGTGVAGGSYTLSGTPSPAVPAGTQLGVENVATYFIQAIDPNTGLPIDADTVAPTSASGITAEYQVSVGSEIQYPGPGVGTGWGFGSWGSGGWGGAGAYTVGNPEIIGLWNAYNFGEDLIYGPKGGPIYYWRAGNLSPVVRGAAAGLAADLKDTYAKHDGVLADRVVVEQPGHRQRVLGVGIAADDQALALQVTDQLYRKPRLGTVVLRLQLHGVADGELGFFQQFFFLLRGALGTWCRPCCCRCLGWRRIDLAKDAVRHHRLDFFIGVDQGALRQEQFFILVVERPWHGLPDAQVERAYRLERHSVKPFIRSQSVLMSWREWYPEAASSCITLC